MGVVYQALDVAKGTPVALKVLNKLRIRKDLKTAKSTPATEEQVRRFVREAEALKYLKHDNIVQFQELKEADGKMLIVMEYVSGINVEDVLESKEDKAPLSIKDAVLIVCQLLKALEYTHTKSPDHPKVIHRDIKPGNLIVTKNIMGKQIVKVADFGLARIYDTRSKNILTPAGRTGVGTVVFTSPEQIKDLHNVDEKTDQYSAAATLYYLLTKRYTRDFGERPYVEKIRLLINEPPVKIKDRNSTIPEELGDIIDKALSTNKADRYENVSQLRDALIPFGTSVTSQRG